MLLNCDFGDTDNLIFSEDLLISQCCSYCLKYLSVGPIVSPSPAILICGRCSKDIDEEEVRRLKVPVSMYNVVAKKIIFRCINYYSGCKKLLFFNEAEEHEESCPYNRILECPYCEHTDNGCSLYNHMRKKHPRYIFSNGFPPLTITPYESHRMIFTKDQCMLSVHIYVGKKIVQVSNLLLTWSNPETRFDFKLKFFAEEGSLETRPITVNGDRSKFSSNRDLSYDQIIAPNDGILFTAMLQECFPSGKCGCLAVFLDSNYWKNLAVEKDYFTMFCRDIDLMLSVPLFKPFPIWKPGVPKISRGIGFYLNNIVSADPAFLTDMITRFDVYLVCGNCKKYISSEVYTCPRYHLACEQCSKEKCPKCKEYCRWNKNSRLHRITLPCDWQGCDSEKIHFFDFTKHKRDCCFRLYMCPACEFIGCRFCLVDHWHVGPLEYEGTLDLRDDYYTYWLKYNELFHITCNFIRVEFPREHSRLLVGIHLVDVILKGYKYDLRYVHPLQENEETVAPFTLYRGENMRQKVHYLRVEVQDLYYCTLSLPDV